MAWHTWLMQTNEQKLEQQIEEAVTAYLRASEQAAATAIQRAFRSVRRQPGGSGVAPKKRSVDVRKMTARRSPEELAAMSKKLSEAVRAQPGETMKTLAAQVGESPRALQVAVARLKRNDEIRTVGSRQFMRYFPAAPTLSASEP